MRRAGKAYVAVQARVRAQAMKNVGDLEKKVELCEASCTSIATEIDNLASPKPKVLKQQTRSRAELAVAKAEVGLAKAKLGEDNSTPDKLEIATANSTFAKENLILAGCGTDKKVIAKAETEYQTAIEHLESVQSSPQHVPIVKKNFDSI